MKKPPTEQNTMPSNAHRTRPQQQVHLAPRASTRPQSRNKYERSEKMTHEGKNENDNGENTNMTEAHLLSCRAPRPSGPPAASA